MDEGDRPETDGDPADRTETSNAHEDERDGTESTVSAEAESTGPDEASDSDGAVDVDETVNSDGAAVSDDTVASDNTVASDDTLGSTERVESVESSEFPAGDTGGNRRAGWDRDGSAGETERDEARSGEKESLAHRFRHDREGALMWVREMLSSVAIVLVIGLILFGISGVWPPMVAVESGSMEPNMEVGDLVFVTEPGRLAPDAADNDVGVVTYEEGQTVDYRTFGSYGSVVIYRPPGRTASPIIHRAMFHVEEGENWYDRADDEYHSAAGCADLRHCPAPHAGFITLGDNNAAYDQANGLAAPVKAEWLTGVARVRVPYLGYVRLIASGQAEVSDVLATTVAAEPDSADRRQATAGSGAVGEPTVSGGGSIASAAA